MKLRLVMAFTLLSGMAARAQGLAPEDGDAIRAGAEAATASRGILPLEVDLSGSLPEPGDQGPSSTCASWAVTYAAGSAALRRDTSERRRLMLSPASTYSSAGGTTTCKGLTKITLTLDVLKQRGALPVEDYRPDPGWCGRGLTPAEQGRAKEFHISGWRWVNAANLAGVKGQLAQGRPVIFGLQVGPPFWAHRGDGVLKAVSDQRPTEGHAMVLVGFDETRQAFRLMNSAGRGWGDGGYAWLAYGAFRPEQQLGFVIEP